MIGENVAESSRPSITIEKRLTIPQKKPLTLLNNTILSTHRSAERDARLCSCLRPDALPGVALIMSRRLGCDYIMN